MSATPPLAVRPSRTSTIVVVAAVLIAAGGLALGVAQHPFLGGCAPLTGGAVGPFPITHIFVLVKENHAFENYFATLPGALGTPPSGALPVAFGSNRTIAPFPLNASSTPDLPHDRASDVRDVNGGQMNGFVAQAAAAGYDAPNDAVGYYTAAQIPQYFTLAHTYALDDEFFSGILGPTLPNRMFDIAATTGGWTSDAIPPASTMSFPTILSQMTAAGDAWAYDYAGSEANLTPVLFPAIAGDPCALAHVQPLSNLTRQVDGPNPPAVTFIDPSHDFTYSEHPDQNVTLGADWTSTVLNTIFDSPIGPSSAVFFFYDENGGFWDPVVPPTVGALGDGVRIPFFVISPYTVPGLVHRVLDPASVLGFIDGRLGLPPRNDRVASAPSLSGFFTSGSAARPWTDLPSPLSFTQISANRSTPLPVLVGPRAPAPSSDRSTPGPSLAPLALAGREGISSAAPSPRVWPGGGSPSGGRSRSCSSRRARSWPSR